MILFCISSHRIQAEILFLSLGYEDLLSLTLMSATQIEELSVSINMKAGHKLKFPWAIQSAREEIKEQEEKDKMEKELAKELAQIERARTLAKAKTDEKSTGLGVPVSSANIESKYRVATITKPDGRASKAPGLPDGFHYHYFTS
jgi:hypothetical protein